MENIKRELFVILYYSLILAFSLALAGIILEFIWLPFVMWCYGADGYNFPRVDRLYKWLKAFRILIIPWVLLLWLNHKHRPGRKM